MRSLLLPTFLLCLGFRPGLAAVPWRTFGCDGFVFTGTNGADKSLDEVWDNAVAMTIQAESQIDLIPKEPKFKLQVSSAEKRAGANAEYMFGTKFEHPRGSPLGTALTGRLGLGPDGSATMATVKASFGEIRAALQANLGDLNPDNAYFFCGSAALVKEVVPNSDIAGPSPIWHLQIRNGETITYVLFSFVTANSPKPCEETGDNAYLGKTFKSVAIIQGETREFYGLLLCPNQWFSDPNVRVWPTLETGFQAEPEDGTQYAYPARYNSISGSLVHEMAHVVARTKGGNWLDIEYGFVESKKLAEGNTAAAIKNPDSYRIFAEMSMSPNTKWNAPAS